MMPIFLSLVNFAVLVLLLITALLGWGQLTSEQTFTHMYWGITTSLLGLFGHSFTMFFFIGTGKSIKELCKDHKPAWRFIAESNGYKRRIYGKAMLANLMLIVQPVLGAAVYSGRLNPRWHEFGFWVTVAVQAWVFGVELRYLGLNNVLMAKVSEWKETGKIESMETPTE